MPSAFNPLLPPEAGIWEESRPGFRQTVETCSICFMRLSWNKSRQVGGPWDPLQHCRGWMNKVGPRGLQNSFVSVYLFLVQGLTCSNGVSPASTYEIESGETRPRPCQNCCLEFCGLSVRKGPHPAPSAVMHLLPGCCHCVGPHRSW